MVKPKSKSNPSMLFSLCVGFCVAILVSFLFMLGLTSLLINGSLPESAMNLGVFIVRSLSVFVGCLIGGNIYKEKILPLIGEITGAYLFFLTLIGVIVFDESFKNFVPVALSVLLGGALACALRFMPKKRTVRNVHRIK